MYLNAGAAVSQGNDAMIVVDIIINNDDNI